MIGYLCEPSWRNWRKFSTEYNTTSLCSLACWHWRWIVICTPPPSFTFESSSIRSWDANIRPAPVKYRLLHCWLLQWCEYHVCCLLLLLHSAAATTTTISRVSGFLSSAVARGDIYVNGYLWQRHITHHDLYLTLAAYLVYSWFVGDSGAALGASERHQRRECACYITPLSLLWRCHHNGSKDGSNRS